MNKKILFISSIVVVLLFLISFSPAITADFSEPEIITPEKDITPSPKVIVFQLIEKLRYYKDIENVVTQEDILQIIENDEELNILFEQLSTYDCGCNDDVTPLDWRFPILCTSLLPLFAISFGMFLALDIEIFLDIMYFIGGIFNCWWYV